MLIVSIAFFAMTFYRSLIVFFVGSLVLGTTNAGIRILRTTYFLNHIPNNLIGRATSVFSSLNIIVRISLISPGFIKTPLTDKNEFKMPFIKSPEFAAEKMFNGLTKTKSFEIHFPKALTIIFKFLRILPYKIYLYLIDKGVKR